MDEILNTSFGRARFVALESVREGALWRENFSSLAKDHRYYELVDATLGEKFEFRYLLLEDHAGVERAIQPLFFVDQDLLATAPKPLRAIARKVRAVFPRFLQLRMLMAGCAAGEGHPPGAAQNWGWSISAGAEALSQVAKKGGARLIIWKDWPTAYREICEAITRAPGFVRVPSMPATLLRLDYAGFEDYMRRQLSHAMRKNLRRKFKATKGDLLTMTVVNNVDDVLDEVHALYAQVFERSALKFERLTKEFLQQLGARMPDRARFFLWRWEGRLVACSICLVHDGSLYDEYLGLDYAVALKLHLYFVTMRDVLIWAMENGIRTYRSTPLNYDPKLHLGFDLAPLDLYVAGTSAAVHAVIRRVLPWIQPTRSEPALREFANAHEMD